jgi:hypothetical protein
MIVHIVGAGWTENSPTPSSVVIVNVPGSWTIAKVVSETLKEVRAGGGRARSINLMKIFEHGNAGRMTLGTGLNPYTVAPFSRLQPLMNPDGQGLELHGCNVGSARLLHSNQCPRRGSYSPKSVYRGIPEADRGWHLLNTLSNLLRVPVTAGLECQYPDPNFALEGRTRTIHPNWKLARGSGS